MARETVNAGDRLVIADAPPITDLNAFTWASWVLLHSSGIGNTTGHIAVKMLNASVAYKRLRLTGDLRLLATVARGSGSASAQSAPGAMTTGTWLHVAMTYEESDGIRMYINGTECDYASRNSGAGATTIDSGTDLILMNDVDAIRTMDGRLGEFGVWNRVLSGDEIALLALRRYAPTLIRAGLAGAWRLEGTATPEPDAINGNHAEVFGTTAAAHPPGVIAALPERPTMKGMLRGTSRRS